MRLPAASLRPYVSGYQLVRVSGPEGSLVEDLIYPGWANIRCVIDGGWSLQIGERHYDPAPLQVLYGASSIAGRLRGYPGNLAGAGLTPLGWAKLFGLDASAYADRLTPLHQLLGAQTDQLVAALTADPTPDGVAMAYDAVLLERLERAPDPHPLLIDLHRLLTDIDVSDVESLSELLSLSSRQVARLTGRLFGFSPKLLLQRHRFLGTLMALREGEAGSWGRQLDPRYYDQAHFVRDCRKFLGLSPSEFFALPRPILEASTRSRAALLGAGAQGLQRPGRASGDEAFVSPISPRPAAPIL